MKPEIPRILVVEDDPTSRSYLVALTESLPARVDAAASVAEALRLAGPGRHDLWLVDARLPDGDGIGLLARLHDASPGTPALAHTAARDPQALQALRDAGFAQVLAKPVDADAWRAAIRHALGRTSRIAGAAAAPDAREASAREPEAVPDLEAIALWDDAAAARALGGNADHVAALRGLFMAELPAQLEQLRGGDSATRREQLHRLRASCAFVGAARLERAVRALQAAPDDDATLEHCLATGQATLASPPAKP